MGVRLIREVIADAPDGLHPLCRLVLLVLAEDSRDSTRRGFPGMPELCRRTGLSQSAVGSVLRELAEWNLDVRVRIGTDKSGRPMYAAKGHRTTYHLPPIAAGRAPERSRVPRTFARPKVSVTEDLSDPQRSHGTPPKVPVTWDPSRQRPTVSLPVKELSGGTPRTTTHSARVLAADEPPPRCPEHINDPTDAPCRACRVARKAHDAWALDFRRAEAAERSAAAHQRAEATRAEIDACSTCNDRGRLPGDILCAHDPDSATRTARGAAAARAALRIVRTA